MNYSIYFSSGLQEVQKFNIHVLATSLPLQGRILVRMVSLGMVGMVRVVYVQAFHWCTHIHNADLNVNVRFSVQ